MASTTTAWILRLVDRVSRPLDTITGAGRRAERQTSAVDRALSRLKSQALASFGIWKAWEGFKGIVKLGNDFESARIKFETLLGSTEKALNLIDRLDEFANATPFQNDALRKNAEMLLNFGVAGNKVIPTIKMLSAVSAGNQDRMNSLTLAYSQVMSAERLMGQDLLQLINAGFNPLQIIAEKTGKSVGYWKDQMRKGNVSAKMVAEAFKIATSEGGRFYGMMDKLSTSGAGKISTFLGTVKLRIAKWSEKTLTPVISKMADFGIAFVNNSSVVMAAVRRLIAPFKPLLAAIGSLIGKMFGIGQESFKVTSIIDALVGIIDRLALVVTVLSNGLVTAINILKPFAPVLKMLAIGYAILWVWQVALNAAMMANPVGLIIGALVILIGIVKTAYDRVGWFRGAIDAIWTSIKGFGKAIKEFVIERIKGLARGITGIGKTLLLFFNGQWSEAWEAGKKATRDLIGVDAAKKGIKSMKQVGKDAAKAYSEGVNSVNQKKALEGKTTDSEKVLGANPTADGLAASGLTTGGGKSDAFGSEQNGISGTGSGKVITQNVTIQNTFKVDKEMLSRIDDIAESIVGKVNDRLRDGLIALN